MNLDYLTIIVVSTLLLGCNSPSKSNSIEKQELYLEQENDKKLQERLLTEKYNIKYDWDTLAYNYSIQYDHIIDGDYQLISNLGISDIFKNDETYNLRIQCGYLPYYFIVRTDNFTQISPLLNKLNTDKYYDDFLMVVEIKEIKKGLFELNAISEVSEYEDASYIELDPSISFFGTGNLIEIKLLK
jgi:hypothetical protein